jgi:AraC-like DNA-binding protein
MDARVDRNLRQAIAVIPAFDETWSSRFVSAIAAQFGVSRRTAHRYVVATFGFGPKRLERIFRFQHFRALMRRQNSLSLTAAAYICGYADHAHLARETRALSAMTPSQIRKQESERGHEYISGHAQYACDPVGDARRSGRRTG